MLVIESFKKSKIIIYFYAISYQPMHFTYTLYKFTPYVRMGSRALC